MIRQAFVISLGIAGVAVCAQPAEATFHFWRIHQVLSSANGSVQYIDLKLASAADDESKLLGHAIESDSTGHKLIFDHNLPWRPVVNQHFLIATPGFAAVSGVTPDYTFNFTPFFDRTGDNLNFASIDFLDFGELPFAKAIARNLLEVTPTPTNFAGQVGKIELPGDATGDGLIDGADYTIWADHYLESTAAGVADGDFSKDGVVDGADYTTWADNYMPGPGPSATTIAAIPEPSTWMLAGIGGLALVAYGAHRRTRQKDWPG